MFQRLARPAGRLMITAALTAALFALGACGDLAAALPARPTPFPTLARLPSVTPITPSATRPPTATPTTVVTPTPAPLLARVAVAANVRAGPGLDFAIVGGLQAGTEVRLVRRSGGWYEIAGPGGVAGWMSGQILDLDPTAATAVPTAAP